MLGLCEKCCCVSAASGKWSCCCIAAGGVNVCPLSDRPFPLPQSFAAASSTCTTRSWCLMCSAEWRIAAAQNSLVCLSGSFCEQLEKHKSNNTYVTLLSSSAACPLQLWALFPKWVWNVFSWPVQWPQNSSSKAVLVTPTYSECLSNFYTQMSIS